MYCRESELFLHQVFGRRCQLGLRKSKKDKNRKKKEANAMASGAKKLVRKKSLRRRSSRRSLLKNSSKKASRARVEHSEEEQPAESGDEEHWFCMPPKGIDYDDAMPPPLTDGECEDDDDEGDDPMEGRSGESPKPKAKAKCKAKAKATPKAKATSKRAGDNHDSKSKGEADDSKKGKVNKKPKKDKDVAHEATTKGSKVKDKKAKEEMKALARKHLDHQDYEYMIYFATGYGIDKNAKDLRVEVRKELPWYDSCTYDVYYSKVRKGVGVFLRQQTSDGKKINLGSFGFAQTTEGFIVSVAAAICLVTQRLFC